MTGPRTIFGTRRIEASDSGGADGEKSGDFEVLDAWRILRQGPARDGIAFLLPGEPCRRHHHWVDIE
jgi:hypothetical protein